MVKKVLIISIMVIALAAGRTYGAQTLPQPQRGSDQPSQNPWGSQGLPSGVPMQSPGDGGHKGKDKDKERPPHETEQDQTQVEKQRADERMRVLKNNTVVIMKAIAAITQGLTKMMERDMSPEAMAKIMPFVKDISGEMAEMQTILSKERPTEDELVTLRLKTEVTKKKMEQLK
jgi:hypothetical protein